MGRKRSAKHCSQAWVELHSDDPVAVSALGVARTHLAAGRALRTLRRMRLFELSGALPDRDEIAERLHRSIQFYNPHKERCTVRAAASEPVPIRPGERIVLVFDRDGARRSAAERWWRHETGTPIEVREGVVWALSFEEPAVASTAVEDLALVRSRRHGLLCNPHSQEVRLATESIPLPWIAEPETQVSATRSGRKRGG